MPEPAYIAIDPEGYITLYWGDGTEEEKYVIYSGPRAVDAQQIAEVVEDLTTWAEENGYIVVVPEYDFEIPEPVEIDPPEDDLDQIDIDDVDNLLDDLDTASEEDY